MLPVVSSVQLRTTAYDWDDHAVNWDMRTAMLARLPQYDQVVTTLINDLFQRGLDKKVLLIVTGEFGRTPRLEFQGWKDRPRSLAGGDVDHGIVRRYENGAGDRCYRRHRRQS